MGLIGAIRCYIFAKRGEKVWANHNMWLFVFICIFWIAGLLTWEAYYSIFPIMGMTAGTVAFWLKDPRQIRIISLIAPPLWFIYSFIVGSYPGMANELFIRSSGSSSEHFALALKKDPDYPPAILEMARNYMLDGRPAKGLQKLLALEADRNSPFYTDVLLLLAKYYYEGEKRYDEAIRYCEKYLQETPDKPEGLYLLGSLLSFQTKIEAGRPYLLMGSLSGTEPGFALPGGKVVPLEWDFLTDLLLSLLGTPICVNFMGTINAQGNAAAQLNTLGPLDPIVIGETMHMAFILGLPPGWDYASNPIAVTFEP